jgi:hypothetical protein
VRPYNGPKTNGNHLSATCLNSHTTKFSDSVELSFWKAAIDDQVKTGQRTVLRHIW